MRVRKPIFWHISANMCIYGMNQDFFDTMKTFFYMIFFICQKNRAFQVIKWEINNLFKKKYKTQNKDPSSCHRDTCQ